VRVWLYGGGETNGGIADPMYDGCASASNAILVNVNYRLGALGYLALPKAGFEGNQGIQDQLLALRWVQDNIGRFGGDAVGRCSPLNSGMWLTVLNRIR